MSDINYSNENYLKEMEKNARLFEEKMNKLEQVRLNSIKSSKNNDNSPKVFKNQIKNLNNFPTNNKNNNAIEQPYYNYKKNNLNKIISVNIADNQENDEEKYNNFTKKNVNEQKNNSKEYINKNEIIQYRNKIEQLKNEIIDKNKIIKQLEKSLKEKENLPSLQQYEEINNECEKLKVDINERIKTIKNLENENKELKKKIDSLVEQIKSMKEVIKRKTDDIENLKMNLESLKEEISFNNKKMNSLEIQNKKLNIEYENLNKDFQIIKNEKDKMNHELEEQKATIFNYQKEFAANSKKNNKLNNKFDYDNYNYQNMNNLYDKKQNYFKDNIDEAVDDEIYNKTNTFQKEYPKGDLYKYENPKYSNLEKENNNISNKTGGFLRKRNYTNYDLENFKSSQKPMASLSDLESRLSYLISEKKKLENELLKMPEHPRNLNEIKIKKGLNNKISDTEQEINSIRTKIRNFDY